MPNRLQNMLRSIALGREGFTREQQQLRETEAGQPLKDLQMENLLSQIATREGAGGQFGAQFPGVDPETGLPGFFQATPRGETRRLPGVGPIPKTAKPTKRTTGDILVGFAEKVGRGEALTENEQAALDLLRSTSFEERLLRSIMPDMAPPGGPSSPAPSAPSQRPTRATPGAIEHLRQNPGLEEEFRAKYGYLPQGF